MRKLEPYHHLAELHHSEVVDTDRRERLVDMASNDRETLVDALNMLSGYQVMCVMLARTRSEKRQRKTT